MTKHLRLKTSILIHQKPIRIDALKKDKTGNITQNHKTVNKLKQSIELRRTCVIQYRTDYQFFTSAHFVQRF